jgi:hypothetical protein
MQTAESFAAGAPPKDDVTLFVGRVQEAAAGRPRAHAECVAVPFAA